MHSQYVGVCNHIQSKNLVNQKEKKKKTTIRQITYYLYNGTSTLADLLIK